MRLTRINATFGFATARFMDLVVVGIILSATSSIGFAQEDPSQRFGASIEDLTGEQNADPIMKAMMTNRLPLERGRYTGRQWFEHEFEWNEDSIKAPRNTEVPTRRTRLVPSVVNGDGLGPMYNAKSCATCHVAGGGSGVKHNVTLITLDPRVRPKGDHEQFASDLRYVFPALVAPAAGIVPQRADVPGQQPAVRQALISYNAIVHNYSTRQGYTEIRDRLASHIDGGIADEWFVPEHRTSAAIAKQPVIAGRYREIDFYLSQRNSPPLYGLGLINGISDQRLMAIAKRQAEKSGGKITGRVAGKFGWQGQSTSLFSFVESACAGEMGLNLISLSQPPDPADLVYVNASIDMTPQETQALFSFVSSIPKPIEVDTDVASYQQIRDGEKLFNSVGCVSCHIADVNQAKGIFSDLLLHDMGDQLQGPLPAPIGPVGTAGVFSPARLEISNPPQIGIGGGGGYYNSGTTSLLLPEPYPFMRPGNPQFPRGSIDPDDLAYDEFYPTSWDALQREWKTPPLWGVRDTGPYLHDGRAESIEDAILWHGGESEVAKVAFTNLSRVDKELILGFLNSLQAPQRPDAVASRKHE